MTRYEQYPISLSNTLGRKKEAFVPVTPGCVGLYVCGPTVYNDVHLGNVRTFLTFDIIVRYLRSLGYRVRYVRNITDVGHLENDADDGEDKIARKAALARVEPMEIVTRYTVAFHQVMREFNILPPNVEPVATGHIVEQIQTIKTLIDNGLAYVVNGSVYFDVSKYNEKEPYGELSGRAIEDLMESGRKLEGQDEKRNKIDFALWKKASPSHIMRWPSPWSDGFPGWHLECSVMSTKYLGQTFDIHGGGMDLMFPHHECEIAQSKGATGSAPVNYWIHSNMLTVNGQKMSKSLGNSFLPSELFEGRHALLEKGYSPMTVRYFMLQSHYSSTLDISNEALSAAEKGYRKLMGALRIAKSLDRTATAGKEADPKLAAEFKGLVESCFKTMSDDFNTAKTLAVLFDMAGRFYDIQSGALPPGKVDAEALETFRTTFTHFIEEVLGLQDESPIDITLVDGLIQLLLDQRRQARLNKDYTLSDKIRDELDKLGVKVKDGKDGEMRYTIQ